MTETEMLAQIREHRLDDTRRQGAVSLPNHMTPEPTKPAHVKANRSNLWWIRRIDGLWVVA